MEWVISLVEGKEKKKWRNCGQAINVMQGRRNGRTLGASAPPMFGITVNPISTRGADYAHHSTTSPLKFSDLATALPWQTKNIIHIPL